MAGNVSRNGTRRLTAPYAGRVTVHSWIVPAGSRSRGSSPDVLCPVTMRGGWVGPQTRPRHARGPGATGWASRMAHLRSSGAPADRQALRMPAHRDPLVHPVAITEHCVIGDQIRVPAAWCEMSGCRSRFADPAALGETDNRARALAAGWGQDSCGRLMCPACQERHHRPAVREMPAREPEAPGAGMPANAGAVPRGGVRQAVPSLLVRLRLMVSRCWHGGSRWLQLLLALATGSNGWTAPHRVTVLDRRPMPPRPELALMGRHRR